MVKGALIMLIIHPRRGGLYLQRSREAMAVVRQAQGRADDAAT